MPLTCYCEFDYDVGSWFYEAPNDYTTLDTKRGRRCASCKDLIKVGETVAKFIRWRHPVTEVEIDIFGEDGEVYLAEYYHCERCADLWFSLYELGFTCVTPDEDVRDMVNQYARGEWY